MGARFTQTFTEPNDLIANPMVSSGTTGVAATRLNRRCLLSNRDVKAIESITTTLNNEQ